MFPGKLAHYALFYYYERERGEIVKVTKKYAYLHPSKC